MGAEPSPVRPSLLLRYGLACVLSGLALIVTLLLSPAVGQSVFPFFLAAVMVSAWYGGLGPALLATACSALASLYFLLPPGLSLNPTVESGIRQLQVSDERVSRKLQLIDGQLHRLTDMITTLLDVSRLESGQLSLTLAPVDLCALARRTVEQAEGTLTQHAVSCEVPDAVVMVAGDTLRLGQVLDNLLQNAVKYSPNGGTITVRVGQRRDRAFFEVADQGLGIPAEAMPHIFERFYRAPEANGRAISGIGIGLYVVREIVALHGGTIEVASAEGDGSTFTVWLPLASPVPELLQARDHV